MYLIVKGDVGRLPFRDRTFDLVFGSPPYCDCRSYLEDGVDLGISRKVTGWVEWMLRVTEECLRVSRGAVVWVASGPTRGRNYQPACEGLMWEWFRRGGHGYRPCYWHRVGIPGSGGDQWFRADVEYVMCFKRQGKLPWSDNTAMGQPSRWAPGGAMSYRVKDGNRRNQGDGTDGLREYDPPILANPGNLIETNVGGGQMGSPLAHENEAPFPENLTEFFLKSLVPPGGSVLDPFSGSGTTVKVAEFLGRNGIGIDLRMSQCRLGVHRLEEDMRPVSRLNNGIVRHDPLPGQMEFLF